MTREELIQVVKRIIDADGTEEEVEALISEFLAAVPHPGALDVLGKHDDAEQIVDEALSYKPLRMPPARSSGKNG